jgi:Domain of unknown function (DUF4347)/FG-GAP-like repeat/RTX calcium-binding nonapeptide repeat (4 copies)/Calx-beta domain
MPNFNCQVSGSAIAFIDRRVADYQSLIAGVKPGTEVVILDGNRDAIEQITEVLGDRTNIDSIHIISHGAPGSLQLGNGNLSADNLAAYSDRLQQWRSAFSQDAEILIYGCNVAGVSRICPTVRQGINSLSHSESRLKPTGDNFNKQSNKQLNQQSSSEDFRYETGVSTPGGSEEYAIVPERASDNKSAIEVDGFTFIKRIAQLTNTNVTASQNLTGSVAKGGDWELEISTGKSKTPLIFETEVLANYEHVLNTFGAATNFGVGTNPRGINLGNFNADTFPDLVVTNQNSDNISILLGNGTGGFGTATNFATVLSPLYVTSGLFNNDNFSDLALVNGTSSTVSILLADGTGGFYVANDFNVGLNPVSIGIGNFNADTFLDLAVVNANPQGASGSVSILLGNGSGSFGFATNFNVGGVPSDVVVGNFDADNLPDLAVANSLSNDVSILLGNGTGGFGAATNFGAGQNPNSIATGDFNGDTFLDLATVNSGTNNVSILLGNGTGGFGEATNVSAGAGAGLSDLVAKDFNGDNKLDLALAYGSNGATILVGNGNGSFSTPVNFTAGTSPTSIISGDFNADTLPDLAVSNNGSNNVSILLNTPNTVNFGAATYSGTEGATDTVVNIPVTLSGGTPISDVVVPIAINSSSTSTHILDYTFSPNSITFPAGATGAALTNNLAVTIEPDNIAENAETAILSLSTGLMTGGVAGTIAQTTLTITANGTVSYAIAPGNVNISEGNNANISEGNSGTTPLTFIVTRSGATGGASSVNYAIAGTATNANDYNNIGGTSGATGITGTINFAAYETSKTITLGVLGDEVVESNETIAVTLSNPVAPGLTPAITSATATTTIANDDTPGFTVNPKSLSTTETGGKAEFTVKLNAKPTANVSIDLTSDNTAEGTVTPNSITFTPDNWSKVETVTVTGVDDFVADGNKDYKIITAPAVSDDLNFKNLNPDDVAVTNSDNKTPGITVNPNAGLTTTEAGGTANFTIVLNTPPTGDVTINLNSDKIIEGTVSTPIVTFTTANWNEPKQVTVTGFDDKIADGDIDYKIITANTVSTDLNYNNLPVADVSLSNKDDDSVSVSVTPTQITATEGGANGTYNVVLKSQPIAPVTLTLTTDNQIQPIAPLTFTAANWNIAQPVTVIAVDDAIVEGAHSGIITHNVTSADTKYNEIAVAGVIGAIVDNDTATPPIDNDPIVLPPPIHNDPPPPIDNNGNPPPPIDNNGNPPPPIDNNGNPPPPIDNNGNPPPPIVGSPGIIISPGSGLVTTESGGTDQFTIRLNSQPKADVRIGVRSSNEAEGVISTESITFNSTNWNQWQPITITGVDDKRPEFDPDKNYQIVTAPAVSADRDYNGLDAPDALVVNRDNDIPGSDEVGFAFQDETNKLFTNALDQMTPGFVGANAWGDFDNDGDLDLLVMEGGSVPNNYYQSFPRSQYIPKVYSNEGHQGFKPIDTTGLPTVYAGVLNKNGKEHIAKPSATWGDSDNDGDLDILLTGVITDPKETNTASYIPITALYVNQKIENNRPPSYQTQETDPKFVLEGRAKLPGIFNGSAAWGDYNNDGRQDLVLTGDTSSGYIAKVFRNERLGFNDGIIGNDGSSFEEETGVNLPGVIGNAAWGDYNNDGKQDILLTGDTGSEYVAKLYRNTSNGFTEESNPLLQYQNPNEPINYGAWGDSNNDGKLDILLTGTQRGPNASFSPSFTRVLLNNSNYSETKFEERWISTGLGVGFGAWGDEDNDGDLDILLTEWNNLGGIAKVYRQDKDGYFQPIDDPTLPNNVDKATASWGDYDKDGRLDIALTTREDSPDYPFYRNVVKVYRNDTPNANTPPSAPPIFNSPQITQEGVVLSLPSEWGNQIDSQTPNQGLSYNLRVWTTDPNGGEDIKEYVVGPMSLDDGTRQVVQLGNANQAGGSPNYGVGWLLKPDYLIPGREYRWSVQAIDSAWAGSPFVEGQPFTVPESSISKTTLTITATDPNAAETPWDAPTTANPGKFTITRTGGSLASPLDVYYRFKGFDVSDGSYSNQNNLALPGSYPFGAQDYELVSDSEPPQPLPSNLSNSYNFVTIPAGKRSVNMVVNALDDSRVEGDEKVVITLENTPFLQNVGQSSSATVTIADNERNNPPEEKIKLSSVVNDADVNIKDVYIDPDGQKLTYQLTEVNSDGTPLPTGEALPSWIDFSFDSDNNTIKFSQKPNENPPDENYYYFRLTAKDPLGASASQVFSIYTSIYGWVIDGYISGATLFLDANKNGIKDSNEPSTTTDGGGKFDLNIPFDIFDTNKNGEIDPEEGHLVAIGGTDTATGLPLETPVTAPPDSTVVTLLTSLVADLIDKGIAPEEAQSLIKAALSLPAEVDLTSLDPILATNNNQPGGVQVLAAMVKVQNFITQTAASIDGASSASTTDIVKAVVSSIANQAQSGAVLNLSNAAVLAPIIQQSAAKIQQIDPSFNSQQFIQIIPQAATVMAAANQRIDTAVANPAGASIPEAVARVQQVALGATSQDFKAVGSGNKTIFQVVAENTGAALDTQIQAVTLPAGIATPVVTGDADLGSNSGNPINGTNGDDILTGTSSNDVLMGMRGNDSLDGAAGNDTIFGGKGNDILLGNSGGDALYAGRGADNLNGSDGNDILFGGKGDDLLNGGSEDDTLTGGKGLDKFLLVANSGTDTITDFEIGKDLLVLGNGLSFSQLAISQDSGSTLIRIAQTGEILATLGGVSASSISAVNFGLI